VNISEWIEEHGCNNVTHAESNAVAFAARQGISTDGATLFVTVSPCEVCARLLIAAGIVEVVYDEEYRKDEGIRILEKAGVTCVG
jgi:dCMP deaminase